MVYALPHNLSQKLSQRLENVHNKKELMGILKEKPKRLVEFLECILKDSDYFYANPQIFNKIEKKISKLDLDENFLDRLKSAEAQSTIFSIDNLENAAKLIQTIKNEDRIERYIWEILKKIPSNTQINQEEIDLLLKLGDSFKEVQTSKTNSPINEKKSLINLTLVKILLKLDHLAIVEKIVLDDTKIPNQYRRHDALLEYLKALLKWDRLEESKQLVLSLFKEPTYQLKAFELILNYIISNKKENWLDEAKKFISESSKDQVFLDQLYSNLVKELLKDDQIDKAIEIKDNIIDKHTRLSFTYEIIDKLIQGKINHEKVRKAKRLALLFKGCDKGVYTVNERTQALSFMVNNLLVNGNFGYAKKVAISIPIGQKRDEQFEKIVQAIICKNNMYIKQESLYEIINIIKEIKDIKFKSKVYKFLIKELLTRKQIIVAIETCYKVPFEKIKFKAFNKIYQNLNAQLNIGKNLKKEKEEFRKLAKTFITFQANAKECINLLNFKNQYNWIPTRNNLK